MRINRNRSRLRRKHSTPTDSHWITPPTTFLAGPNGCGKSLILDILRLVAEEDPAFPAFDMSDVIRWHRQRPESHFYDTFNRMKAMQDAGKLLPDKPVLHAAVKYIKHHQQRVTGGLKHIAFGGGLRTEEQSKFILRRYAAPRLIEITCTPEESLHGVMSRSNDGRNDSSDPATIRRRFEIAMTESRRGIEHFEQQCAAAQRRNSILRLKRSDPLLVKIQLIIGFIGAPDDVKRLWFDRCQDPAHKAGALIKRCDQRYN